MTKEESILTPLSTGKQSDDFGSSPFFNRKSCEWKEHEKKRRWHTFLLEIGNLTKSALFGGPTLPHSGAVL